MGALLMPTGPGARAATEAREEGPGDAKRRGELR
jgi:hypothetical protein